MKEHLETWLNERLTVLEKVQGQHDAEYIRGQMELAIELLNNLESDEWENEIE